VLLVHSAYIMSQYWDVMYTYVPVDDGWDKVLGHNVYITSQYWDP
jgi:hypothetical protein